MRPSRSDVADMTERDYFAQLICWKRGGELASDDDKSQADKILMNDSRESIRALNAVLLDTARRK